MASSPHIPPSPPPTPAPTPSSPMTPRPSQLMPRPTHPNPHHRFPFLSRYSSSFTPVPLPNPELLYLHPSPPDAPLHCSPSAHPSPPLREQ
ncbi:hypothetical protein E2C01_086358 [Portunus trituberculatus]|uniref:Uncharacterized protein n=1 Tax=Portunus trituberculatus TaxID=210409 RepID=A0A5B7J0K4_PORTR|nr:hypothetical protein [Portunus trituberculatus]